MKLLEQACVRVKLVHLWETLVPLFVGCCIVTNCSQTLLTPRLIIVIWWLLLLSVFNNHYHGPFIWNECWNSLIVWLQVCCSFITWDVFIISLYAILLTYRYLRMCREFCILTYRCKVAIISVQFTVIPWAWILSIFEKISGAHQKAISISTRQSRDSVGQTPML